MPGSLGRVVHHGTDPADRERLEGARRNEVKALVATSALGMGFDKPDLGFVVHLGALMPLVAYYQQVGCAGRHRACRMLLLPGPEDKDIWAYFASVSMPREEQAQKVPDTLAAAGGPVDGRAGNRGRRATHPAWSCCSRCSTSTVPCSACRAGGCPRGCRGPTTPSATNGSLLPAGLEQQLMIDYERSDPAGWPSSRRP